MKDLFPGHFKENDESLREAWKTSLFVFDANILLNLYRYSDTTRSEFLRILDKVKDRVWLPHRAAEEYLNNRLSVIGQQEKSYDDTVKSIDLLRRNLDNARQHPFVSKIVMKRLGSVFDELCNELEDNKSVHTTRISNDEIKDSIANIFENRVGLPYDKKRIELLIAEGEERYKQKIPPGFNDSSKSGDSEVFSEKCRKYGDLFVWTQVIDKATELNKGVVLVTDDKKNDWWEIFKGKTIGPRPDLVKEFKDRANQTFHMYQADRFLELARENLGEKVSEEIVEEIREVRRRDDFENREIAGDQYHVREIQKAQLEQELVKIVSEMVNYEIEVNRLQREKSNLKEYRNKIFHGGGGEHTDDIQMPNHYFQTTKDYGVVSKNYEEASRRLHMSQLAYQKLKHHINVLEDQLSHGMKSTEKGNAADS